MAVVRIDPSSEVYQRFSRLYEAARALRPSEIDRWNGELFATVGEDTWGSLQRDGSFQLSKELVLYKLGPNGSPQEQVQALTTVLHESNHARVEVNAPDEPNAVLSRHSKALDEGLTEWVSVNDVQVFADSTGYGELPDATPEYPAAHSATESLLEYAAGPDGADRLAGRAIDAPVVMRWDVIADEIVRERLGEVVPANPQHQQAARAELVNAMIQPGWEQLDRARPSSGPEVSGQAAEALNQAQGRIRQHYSQNPDQPYPARTPNQLIASAQSQTGHQDPQQLTRQADLSNLPPPDPASRIVPTGPQPGRQMQSQTSEMRFLSGSAPAAQATRQQPSLGDGRRGAGAPSISRPARQSNSPARE